MWDKENRAFIAINSEKEICLIPSMANRHGLIAGATGTGKTVTLQTLSETFSQMGVPVFIADVKGDLTGLSQLGGNKESINKRVGEFELESKGFKFQGFPVQIWDAFGENGIPLRLTIKDLGATLLSRILNLSDAQSSILTLVFKIANDEDLELIDLKDLQKMLEYLTKMKSSYLEKYGNLSTTSLSVIQRKLIELEQEKGDYFFGELSINLEDFIKKDISGKGIINILMANKLINSPKIYTTFLLWMLTNLFDKLPEVGDPEKPKLVFFFDEAHLLFKDLPKVLLDRVEQVVRLIRSKGVGVYFISQLPTDIPNNILGQLGNRIQHAIRAYTPNDIKSVKLVAQTFRTNPELDTEKVITELQIGEALVSFLNEKGSPVEVERAFILPPESLVGASSEQINDEIVKSSLLYSYYSKSINRDTAHEKLTKKIEDLRLAKAKEESDKIAAKEQAQLEKRKSKNSKSSSTLKKSLLVSIFVPIVRSLLLSFIKGKKK